MVTWISMTIAAVALVVGVTVKMLWPKSPLAEQVEEIAEELIEKETGIDIELSPDDVNTSNNNDKQEKD